MATPRLRSLSRSMRAAAGNYVSDMLGQASRGRSPYITPRSVSRGRSSRRSPSVMRRASLSTVSTSSRRSAGASMARKSVSLSAGSVSKSGKRLKVKGRKRVKVSRSLRNKIVAVTDSRQVHGYYQDNRIDVVRPGQFGSGQNVQRLPNDGLNFGGYLFNYDRVLHAASRLWNQKGPVTAPLVSDATNFDARDSVINVTKQWWTFRLRNNSTRCATIRVYKCQPKNSVQSSDALFQWRDGITQMINEGQLTSTPVVTVNTLHTGPTLANQFRAAYRTECITIKLDPGQGHTFNVNGPAMTYKGDNFYDAAAYKGVQKQDIQLIWVSNADLVGTHIAEGTPNNFGYAPDSIQLGGGTQERVIVESTYHCSMTLPEKVGGILTVAALATPTLFQNNLRVKRVVIDDFAPSTWGTVMHRRDDENPAVDEV